MHKIETSEVMWLDRMEIMHIKVNATVSATQGAVVVTAPVQERDLPKPPSVQSKPKSRHTQRYANVELSCIPT